MGAAPKKKGKEIKSNKKKMATKKEEPPKDVKEDPQENHEEEQYLNLIRWILERGQPVVDRTEVGVLSSFGHKCEYDLRHHFPLFTTKKVHFLSVVRELLWFISGSTDVKKLEASGCRIWNANVRDNGWQYDPTDAGPIYPHQWRHAGAAYHGKDHSYQNRGIDQIRNVIHQLKVNPRSRRHVVCSWSPTQLHEMCLPPCHVLFQFYVEEDGTLSCSMYQRSGDVGLGIPFNVASYALLTCMIAQVCGRQPGRFIHMLGDVHIYRNHIEALTEQIKRQPYPFPQLRLNPEVKDIDAFQEHHIQLIHYQHHPSLPMKMAV
jgi:thymidylate synthase